MLWVDLAEVLAIHQLQLAEHGGGQGLRDQGLLESALARPRNLAAYGKPDRCDLAAAYTFGLLSNHPFVDGNKRAGFVVGALFLEINGLRFVASEVDATRAVLELAVGTISEVQYAEFLRANVGEAR